MSKLQALVSTMYLSEDVADIIAVAMAGISVAFVVPALMYAYALRDKISKTLLILAASKNVYKYLFMVLGFAAAGSILHLIYHIGEFQSLPIDVEFAVHMAIDASFILISLSLFLTFKTAYAMVTDEKGQADVEKILRQAMSNISRKNADSKTGASAS